VNEIVAIDALEHLLHRRGRHGIARREGFLRPVNASSEATQISPLAAVLFVAALRIECHQVASL
jgi:hypothetical protein